MKNKRLYVLLAFAALALASPCQAQQTSRQQNATPQQALDKRQAAFQADKAKGVHATYQWELSGPNGGEWWLSVDDGTYKTGRERLTIQMSRLQPATKTGLLCQIKPSKSRGHT